MIEEFATLEVAVPRYTDLVWYTYRGPKLNLGKLGFRKPHYVINKGDEIGLQIYYGQSQVFVKPPGYNPRVKDKPHTTSGGTANYYQLLQYCVDKNGQPAVEKVEQPESQVKKIKVTPKSRELLERTKAVNALTKREAYGDGLGEFIGTIEAWYLGPLGMTGKKALKKSEIKDIIAKLSLVEELFGTGKSPVKIAYRVCLTNKKVEPGDQASLTIGPREVLSFTQTTKGADGFNKSQDKSGHLLVSTSVTPQNYVTCWQTCVKLVNELVKPANLAACKILQKEESGMFYLQNVRSVRSLLRSRFIKSQQEVILKSPKGKFPVTVIKQYKKLR